MVKIGVLRLLNYESWINSLGYDREHIIQAEQHKLLRILYESGAEIGAFTIPLTRDIIVLVLNSVELRKFLVITKSLIKSSPVSFRVMVGLGKTYPEALIKIVNPEVLMRSEPRELTIAAHADLNGYYNLLKEQGIYRTYETIVDFVEKFRRLTHSLGGIASYLGGDNVLAFLPDIKSTKTFITRLSIENKSTKVGDIKVGIGIASIPRTAITLAAKALATLREKRREDTGDTQTTFEIKQEQNMKLTLPGFSKETHDFFK